MRPAGRVFNHVGQATKQTLASPKPFLDDRILQLAPPFIANYTTAVRKQLPAAVWGSRSEQLLTLPTKSCLKMREMKEKKRK